MGWKISLVIIENNNKFSNDELLLKKAGFRTIKKVDTVDFETALGTKNKICIGNINDNIVICDDYKLTEYFLSENNNLDLTEGEKNISSLFPTGEQESYTFDYEQKLYRLERKEHSVTLKFL